MSRIDIVNEGPVTRLKIHGAFDETIKLPENLNCTTVIVDLDEITTFNSMGVRIWLMWVQERRGFRNLRLENCRPPFVKQLAFVAGLLPEYGLVDSFYVPYFAPVTQEEVEIKFTVGKEYDSTGLHLPQIQREGQELELDVDDSYFSFLKLNQKAK